jgi:hypothetical protein
LDKRKQYLLKGISNKKVMKITHDLVKGKVKEIYPNIFCAMIDDSYDLGMLFCRYQEYYESPINKIRRNYFTLPELMREYRKFFGRNYFSYPEDWVGYNIPSEILLTSAVLFHDETEYDEIMFDIVNYCQSKLKFNQSKWYLIGAGSKDVKIMNHELAHAFYYTNQKYRDTMFNLLTEVDKKDFKKLCKILLKLGYVDFEEIIMDEAQAFLSTGLINGMEFLEPYAKEFKKVFKKYKK